MATVFLNLVGTFPEQPRAAFQNSAGRLSCTPPAAVQAVCPLLVSGGFPALCPAAFQPPARRLSSTSSAAFQTTDLHAGPLQPERLPCRERLAPNNALQRTALCVLPLFLLFSSPSLSLGPLGARPLCFVLGGHVGFRACRLHASRPGPSSASVRLSRRQGPSFPRRGVVGSRSPDSEFHAPNHALQRTPPASGLCLALHALLRRGRR